MRDHAGRRIRWRLLSLLPLPLLAGATVGVGVAWPEPTVTTPARWESGWLDATATLIPAMPMKDMIAPMPMDHSPEVQVVIQMRNTTSGPVTVAFEKTRLWIAGAQDGEPAEATAGQFGARTIRPHAAIEERLRFRAPHGADRVRLTVPNGGDEMAVALKVRQPGQQGSTPPPGAPLPPLHGHDHGHGDPGGH
jgi:hypothetical protein